MEMRWTSSSKKKKPPKDISLTSKLTEILMTSKEQAQRCFWRDYKMPVMGKPSLCSHESCKSLIYPPLICKINSGARRSQCNPLGLISLITQPRGLQWILSRGLSLIGSLLFSNKRKNFFCEPWLKCFQGKKFYPQVPVFPLPLTATMVFSSSCAVTWPGRLWALASHSLISLLW